jgi:hypothetical protein
MATPVYYKNIQRLLYLYADIVEQSNSIGLSDETIHAEDFFCHLLNKIFKWKLTNANRLKKNQDSFDLIQSSKGIYVQVTSNKNYSAKYNRTVQSFAKQSKKKNLKRLNVFFISKKCPASLLKPKKENGFIVEAYDIPKLLTEIHHRSLPSPDLKYLNSYIQDFLAPALLAGTDHAVTETVKHQVPSVKIKGLVVNRQSLIDDLFTYSQLANGLIIGGPGVGKSYTIEQLQQHYKKQKLPCFVIRINELLSGSDDEINTYLGIKRNWLSVFRKMRLHGNPSKGLLIFDAFDTAKDEQLKAAVLLKIKQAIKELKNEWNIIVSSRSFEATKSTRLLELFPQININKPVYCRYFEIPDLSVEEVKAALKQKQKLYSIYLKSTPDLQAILRTPYFLKLYERIILENKNLRISEISHIETAEQLLSKFWGLKVDNESTKDLFLRQLTNILVTKENLVIKKADIVTDRNVTVLDQLMSDGILVEGSVSRQNISFSHNILLEYAVALYLIPEDAESIRSFITDNQKLPFHFRQSFIYFYNNLWRKDTSIFWKHYHEIRVVNTPLFRLYHQTILNYTLVTGFQHPKELLPVWSISDSMQKGNAIRKILEGIRFLKKTELKEKDLQFLFDVSQNMHESFLWELGFLINKGFENQIKNNKSKFAQYLTKAAFNYMQFVLKARLESPNKQLIEINGGNWGVRNLCECFAHDKKTAARFVGEILQILKEPEFPIRFFWLLGDGLTKIYSSDKEFGILVFKALYYHTETSDKETSLGNGVVLNLRSNRRQDFESIHHKLETDFQVMLSESSAHAIKLGIEITNKFNKANRYSSWKGKSLPVHIIGQQSKISQDFEIEESADDEKYGHMAPLAKIFAMLQAKSADSRNKSGVLDLMRLAIKTADASSVWKRIIKLFTKYPKVFRKEANSLLHNLPFFVFEETAYETGELIKALWPILLKSEKKQLEETILSIATTKLIRKDPEFAKHRILRFLNCIPRKELLSKKAIKLIEENDKKENKPILERPRLGRYHPSDDERITRAGFDVTDKVQADLYTSIGKIEQFNSKLDRDFKLRPVKKEYSPLISIAIDFFNSSKENSFPNVLIKEHCDYQVSNFARILTRVGNKLPKKLRVLVEDISINYINDRYYISHTYEPGDIKTRGTAFTPSARTNAVGSATMLLLSGKSSVLAPVVKPLAADNALMIRFKTMRSFTYFWHNERTEFWRIMRERYSAESDGLTLGELIHNISYNNIIEDNISEAEFAAEKLISKLRNSDEKVSHELWQNYSAFLVKLIFFFNSGPAISIFRNNLSVKPLARFLVLHLLSVIDPHDPSNNYVLNPGKHDFLFGLLKDIIDHQFDSIHRKGTKSDGISDHFEIIDHLIQHLNFTILEGKKNNKGKALSAANEAAFFAKLRPLLSFITDESAKIDSGFMVAHTGYYFIQLLNRMIYADPEYILSLASQIVQYAAASGFTYDNTTLAEIVKLTESILADHKSLLNKPEHFNNLITILDQFANSGWQEAIELTWKLKEAF